MRDRLAAHRRRAGPADAALAAADHLMTRVLEPAGIIQAWGDLDDPRQRGRTIIDSLMNTPLLFWASQTTGDARYADGRAPAHRPAARPHPAARRHDVPHVLLGSGDRRSRCAGETEQGNADDSCWARGQAWGIYGFALNHRYTGDASFLDAARRCADYFLAHLPADQVAYWDLVFGDGSGEERDSSAAAIAVVRPDRTGRAAARRRARRRYRAAAGRILARSSTGTPPPADPSSNALMLHGVYDKPKGVGVDEGNLWGDYFYLEALTRVARPDWTLYW